MSWLNPFALLVAAGALGTLAVVHMVSRSRPGPVPFPTARFVPDRAQLARVRAWLPSDALLFALRSLAIIAVGAAFAVPVLTPPSGSVRRIIAIENSRAVASPAEARDSARALARPGSADRVFVFDTIAVSYTHLTLPTKRIV